MSDLLERTIRLDGGRDGRERCSFQLDRGSVDVVVDTAVVATYGHAP